MNWSLYTADRTTHLKIVAVGLAASFMIAVIGISVRDLNLGTDIITAQTPAVVKLHSAYKLTNQPITTALETAFAIALAIS